MEPNTDNCSKCGKPRSGTKGATMTQWLSVCQCDALALSNLASQDGEKTDFQVCQTCGKRVEEKRAGSLTQWIFKDSSCRCDFPQIAMAPAAPPTAPVPVGVRKLSEDVDETNIGFEFDAIIQEEEFEPENVNKNPVVLKTAVLIVGVLGVLSIGAVILVAITPPPEKFNPTEREASTYSSSVEYEIAERAPPEVIGSIGVKLNGNKIIETQRFTPAAEEGVLVGDEILSIDGTSVKGENTDVVSRKLLGACKSPVTLVVLRGQEEVTLNVTRAEDIYEGIKDNLTAKQYFDLGTQAKFAGRPNRSRLAYTLAKEHGDAEMKKLAKQEIMCELPKNFVPFEAQYLVNEAHNLLAVDAYKSVVVMLKECIEKYPNCEWPYLDLGLYYYVSEKPDKCEEQLQKVLSLNPNMTRAWIAMSILKQRQGDKAEAERCMDQASKLSPRAYKDKVQMSGVLDVLGKRYKKSFYRLQMNKELRLSTPRKRKKHKNEQ